MKWKIIIPVAIVAVAAIAIVASAMGGATKPAAPGPAATTSSSSGGAAILPISTNPITNNSSAAGLTVVSAKVEDNVDPSTQQPIADRLQVQLKNTSSSTLTGFEIFYTMKDVTTQKTESYYVPLTGVSLAVGAETTVYFDNETGAGHFPENKFSIYRSSQNQVDFSIEVSAKGVAVAHGTASKGVGTGEVVGG